MVGKSHHYPEVLVGPRGNEPVAMPPGTDPFFLWACLTKGSGLGHAWTSGGGIAGPPARKSVSEKGTSTGPLASDSTGTSKAAYLSFIIRVPDDEEARAALLDMATKDSPCLRVSGAYKQSVRIGEPHGDWKFKDNVTHLTALVSEARLLDFIEDTHRAGIRWELSQSRVRLEYRNSSSNLSHTGKVCKITDVERDFSKDPLLSGDVMVIIDHGCPFAHPAYRKREGGTRVRHLWLQDTSTLTESPLCERRPIKHSSPHTLFAYGWDLRGSDLDALMQRHTVEGDVDEAAVYAELGYELMRETSSHGSHVMSIACGAPNPLSRKKHEDRLFGYGKDGAETWGPDAQDAAGESSIIFVQLPQLTLEDTSGGGLHGRLLDAVYYALNRVSQDAHVVFVCSFGTQGGPHDGSRFIDEALAATLAHSGLKRRPEMVFPVGNSFNAACHAQQTVRKGQPWRVRVEIAPDKDSDTVVEWWIPCQDFDLNQLTLMATLPSGESLTLKPDDQACTLSLGQASSSPPSLTLIRNPNATPDHHRILAVIAPTMPSIDPGERGAPYGHWSFELSTIGKKPVQVDARIERDDAFFTPRIDIQSRFVVPHQEDSEREYDQPTWLTKQKTQSPFAANRRMKVAGALTRSVARDALFTSEATPTALIAPYSAASTGKVPHYLAYVDDSSDLRGRLACGHQARTWVRCIGTSIAAPQVARALLNAMSPDRPLIVTEVQASGVGISGTRLDKKSLQLQRRRLGSRKALPW